MHDLVGESYGEQAAIVLRYRDAVCDLRDRLALPEHDARHVALNNLTMPASAGTSILRMLNFGYRQDGPAVLCQMLGVSAPEYLVVEWAALHQAELARVWQQAETHQPLDKIDPLR